MKKHYRNRFISALIAASMLASAIPTASVTAANVQETSGIQLQTILVDNDGKDWTTLSWGGENMIPNTNWTTLDIRDYYENGTVNFEVKNNGSGTVKFKIGLGSYGHGEDVRIYWTDLPEYADISADSSWKSYSLPIRELVDAFPDSGFSLADLRVVYVGGVPSGTTLSFQNVTITSPDDEHQFPIIKVDQVGYPSAGKKSAKISYFEKFGSLTGKTFEVVDSKTDKVAYTGKIPEGSLEETFSGEMVHIITFDELKTAGTYYIRIPDAGLDSSARSPRDISEKLDLDLIKSVSFEISDNVYDSLLSELTKYYYYQRQGIEIEEKYAGIFARENLHPDDITVKRWSDRDNPNAETFDVSGGWYDAGDYGKYTSPGANSINDLLLAYELYPDIFADIEMNIPETDPDNPLYVDAPGILSEIKYELDMLLKLEHRSKDGSFYTAANYDTKTGIIYIEDTLYKSSDHNSDSSQTDLRCHLATADMAGVLAHAYMVYRDVPAYEDYAQQCLETSLRAWEWINNPENKLNMSIGAANRTYTFKEADFERSRFQAAGALYRAVKLAGGETSEYENYLLANCQKESINNCFTSSSISYSHSSRSFLGFFHYLYNNDDADSAIKEVFEKYTEWRTKFLKNNNWGLIIPTWGFWWGSNKYVAQTAMTLTLGDLAAYGEVKDESREVIERHFHYLLGVNPLSFSYVSGFGENSVDNIYSAIYTKDARLEPYQSPAGYFTEGANNHNNPHLSKFVGKCYTDSTGEYTTNENTIYGNAAMIFLTAAMMSQNKPESIRGDVNADGSFNIADVVMLQKWILGSGEIINWQAGDFLEDNVLDAFDVCVMRKELIS